MCADNWQTEFESFIRNYINNLQNSQRKETPTPPSSPEHSENVTKLQAQIQRYKEIIDETVNIPYSTNHWLLVQTYYPLVVVTNQPNAIS